MEFQDKGWEKENNKDLVGKGGKKTFLNHTSSLLVWLEMNRMAR